MMKEEIKEQKEKVKQMSRKERFRYFWYYNWIKLALGGLALLFVAYLGYTIYNNQNNESIYVAMINSVMTGDDQQALMDGFVESRQIDTENAPARINANMQLLEEQYTNLSLANSQSLQAYIETGDYDVLVADEWIIRDFASQALLRDLSEALPTEIYEQVKDRLVYYDYDIPSYEFCKRLYDETGAFVTPSDCFEQPKCMRIGYACDKKTLEDGLSALAAFAQKLS